MGCTFYDIKYDGMQNKKGRTITFRVDDEVAELAEHQTLAQSATVMLTQASAISQNILLFCQLTYRCGHSCPQSSIIKQIKKNH